MKHKGALVEIPQNLFFPQSHIKCCLDGHVSNFIQQNPRLFKEEQAGCARNYKIMALNDQMRRVAVSLKRAWLLRLSQRMLLFITRLSPNILAHANSFNSYININLNKYGISRVKSKYSFSIKLGTDNFRDFFSPFLFKTKGTSTLSTYWTVKFWFTDLVSVVIFFFCHANLIMFLTVYSIFQYK